MPHGESILGLVCSHIAMRFFVERTTLLQALIHMIPRSLVQSDSESLCKLLLCGITPTVADCMAFLAPLCPAATQGPSALALITLVSVGGPGIEHSELYCMSLDCLLGLSDSAALAASSSGETALHVSVQCLNVEAVKRLVVLLPMSNIVAHQTARQRWISHSPGCTIQDSATQAPGRCCLASCRY